jgi:hypothetical protein
VRGVIPYHPIRTKAPKMVSSTRWLEIDDYTIQLLYRHKDIQDKYLAEETILILGNTFANFEEMKKDLLFILSENAE